MAEIQRFPAVAAILVTPDGKLVAQLRDDKPGLPYPNCWATLGGGIEPGEDPDKAMQRELIEEIGFSPPMHFWRVFELDFPIFGVPAGSQVYAYIGQLDCDLAAINLHEGQRLAAIGPDDVAAMQFAYGLDAVYAEFFRQRPDQFRLTLAMLDEAHIVHQIMRDAFAEYEGVLQPSSGANKETVTDVQQAMVEGGALLAWLGDIAVGAARFRLDPDEMLYVGRVAVLPAYRKHGVGRALMLHMEAVARQHQRTKIHVGVRMALPQNITFYQHLGYEIVLIEPHPRGFDQVATMVKDLLSESHSS
jgi:8-oxo-dGTP pyrophosphatase MutT (NUDIX family)/predicted GNAT family N-acyltransferase